MVDRGRQGYHKSLYQMLQMFLFILKHLILHRKIIQSCYLKLKENEKRKKESLTSGKVIKQAV